MGDDASTTTSMKSSRGTRNEETHQHNLSLILRAVHTTRAPSRSALTHWSGLNRSTVGALVSQLVERELVMETVPQPTKRAGRPSPVVSPNPDVVALAINPDRAGLTCAVVGLGGAVHMRETISAATTLTPERTVSLAARFARRVGADLPTTTRVAGVGVAVPGLVDSRDQSVVVAPALGWSGVPIASLLAEELGIPAVAVNDASAGMVAESLFGAAAGFSHAVYLNGSYAGVGGGVVVNGALFEGSHGLGAELGHLLIDSKGPECDCGRRGCLQAVVSLDAVSAALGVDRVSISDLDFIYATDRSPSLAAELDRQADFLALAIAIIVSLFGTERVVVGGHVGALFDSRAPRVRQAVKDLGYGPLAAAVSISRNRLRERMVSIGAAELAFAPLLSDPAGTALLPLPGV